MMKALPSLLLSVQLLFANAAPPSFAEARLFPTQPGQERRLMWGLIDPELAAWFSLLPEKSREEDTSRVLWDWSWQGFLAALFGDSILQEVTDDGTYL